MGGMNNQIKSAAGTFFFLSLLFLLVPFALKEQPHWMGGVAPQPLSDQPPPSAALVPQALEQKPVDSTALWSSRSAGSHEGLEFASSGQGEDGGLREFPKAQGGESKQAGGTRHGPLAPLSGLAEQSGGGGGSSALLQAVMPQEQARGAQAGAPRSAPGPSAGSPQPWRSLRESKTPGSSSRGQPVAAGSGKGANRLTSSKAAESGGGGNGRSFAAGFGTEGTAGNQETDGGADQELAQAAKNFNKTDKSLDGGEGGGGGGGGGGDDGGDAPLELSVTPPPPTNNNTDNTNQPVVTPPPVTNNANENINTKEKETTPSPVNTKTTPDDNQKKKVADPPADAPNNYFVDLREGGGKVDGPTLAKEICKDKSCTLLWVNKPEQPVMSVSSCPAGHRKVVTNKPLTGNSVCIKTPSTNGETIGFFKETKDPWIPYEAIKQEECRHGTVRTNKPKDGDWGCR